MILFSENNYIQDKSLLTQNRDNRLILILIRNDDINKIICK